MHAVNGPYSGPDFSVMPTGIMSNVYALLVEREYRRCESTFHSNSSSNFKVDKTESFFETFLPFLVRYNFLCEMKLPSSFR